MKITNNSITMLTKDKKYKWEFINLGGSSRVKIRNGEDIAHLGELDHKMWTVLSCPVKGLEIDDKSLAYMDTDGDGKIHVDDVVKTAQWITSLLKNNDLILEGVDSIELGAINTEIEAGKKLYNSAKQIVTNLGKANETISLADTADCAAIFAQTKYNGDGVITETSAENDEQKAAIVAAVATVGGVADRSGAAGVDAAAIENFYKALADYVAWTEAEVAAPFGDKTDATIAAYNALDAKVKDFFMRSKLAAFTPDSTASLDVQTSSIASISADNLTGKLDQIASYPLARVVGKAEINLEEPVNPAWAAQFELVKAVALADGLKVITEADWAAIGAKFAAYSAWKGSKAGAAVESLGLETVKTLIKQDKKAELLEIVAQDAALKEESDNIEMVNKFLHILRDFYRLLRNFVTLQDFYDKDKKAGAIFQVGRLIIDQRECRFCMNVEDMGKHTAMAAKSGMFLVYCDCVTKSKPGKLQICAAVTVGEIGDLVAGKNAIFYDNNGLDWDAVVTKVVDNPISVAQAFWSPYRRMATAVENLITKSAADKDAKMMKNATDKINAAPAALPANANADAAKTAAPPFDIAKFAGIFAALGMALGMIGTALVSVAKGLAELDWWELILLFVGIMLLISGPAMILAWLKLRRRNIAPLLNANGWAVNATAKIGIPFGETLTDVAVFPKLKLKDPYSKDMPAWKKIVITLSVLVVVAGGLWLGNLLKWANLPSPLPRFNKTEVVVEEVTETAVADTVQVTEVVAE